MATVDVTVHDGVGTISLNRPHRHNAVDDELHEALHDSWARVMADPAVRVMLVRGNGPSFCSGRDTAQLGERVAGESDLSVVRIASTDLRMAFPEIRYGLMTDTGGAGMATMLAGPSRAKWLLMTGRPIGAEQALAWGLVDQVVAPEELDATATELAAEIATRPPEALAMIKMTVDGMWQGQLLGALRNELLGQVALFGGEDYKERKRARLAGP